MDPYERDRENLAVGESESMEEVISNVARASAHVSRELMNLALGMRDELREDFFDPRNKDQWIETFCERLLKQRKAKARASND